MAASHLLWALWGVIQAKVSPSDIAFLRAGQVVSVNGGFAMP